MSLAGVLADISTRLARAGVPSPSVDAEFLLAHVTGLGRGELLAKIHQGLELEQAQLAKLDALVVRRE
ncbi:MAG: peptide chain release factor N(5)-glutamine methyltransferase, partial [Pontimonas sp.]|nr:peptide chain release factor N(5)-glutamine methyltransferase [Pontimonas sp.]